MNDSIFKLNALWELSNSIKLIETITKRAELFELLNQFLNSSFVEKDKYFIFFEPLKLVISTSLYLLNNNSSLEWELLVGFLYKKWQ